MIVVQFKQFQGTHGEAGKDGPSPNHIRGMLVRYKNVFTNVLLKKFPPRNEKQLCSTRDWVVEVCGDKWSWWTNMKNVKEIQEENWPLTQKTLRSLVGLANYYHHFIRIFFSGCIDKDYRQEEKWGIKFFQLPLVKKKNLFVISFDSQK